MTEKEIRQKNAHISLRQFIRITGYTPYWMHSNGCQINPRTLYRILKDESARINLSTIEELERWLQTTIYYDAIQKHLLRLPL